MLPIPSIQPTFFDPLSHEIDYEKIREIGTGSAAFVRGSDSRPIVTTFGCGCSTIALGGYVPSEKIAFIIHFQSEQAVIANGELLRNHLFNFLPRVLAIEIQLHLRGGTDGSFSKQIKDWINSNSFSMSIVSEKACNRHLGEPSQSLLIDSRNGVISDYDPFENPIHKDGSLGQIDLQNEPLDENYPQISLFSTFHPYHAIRIVGSYDSL